MDHGAAYAELCRAEVAEVYHLTHLDNLGSICRQGIVPRAALGESSFRDLALASAIERRFDVYAPFGRNPATGGYDVRPLEQLVPAFFVQRNPMSYKLRGWDAELCWLCIDPRALCCEPNWIFFSNGNLASQLSTLFRLGHDSLDRIPWRDLRQPRWDGSDQERRHRGAEMLFWPAVPLSAVTRVEVRSASARQRAVEVVGELLPAGRVTVNTQGFFPA